MKRVVMFSGGITSWATARRIADEYGTDGLVLLFNDDAARNIGVDWSEMERLPGIVRNWAPWTVEAPLTRPPYADKKMLFAELRSHGIVEPRLYALGFAHNNCGGACVKAGQAQWAHLLRVFPDRYASWEQHEQEMRAEHGDIAILRDRRDGITKPLPLTVLRQRVESQTPDAFDGLDWGGCGCFTTSEVAA
jgi:hypothetical protein